MRASLDGKNLDPSKKTEVGPLKTYWLPSRFASRTHFPVRSLLHKKCFAYYISK